MNAQEIRDLFKRHNLPLSMDDVWEVRPGAPVVRHQALERLGAAIKVTWLDKQIIRCERDEAVILVSGHIGHGLEWSIGEAVIGQNYKVSGKMAAYPYAMAEKRAKDRVILKLAGLHGAYSEAEADDFRQGSNSEELKVFSSKDIYIERAIGRIGEMESAPQLLEWAKKERKLVWPQYEIDPHDEDGQRLVTAYKERMAVLEQAGETEAVE